MIHKVWLLHENGDWESYPARYGYYEVAEECRFRRMRQSGAVKTVVLPEGFEPCTGDELEIVVETFVMTYAASHGFKVFKTTMDNRKGWPDLTLISPRGVHGYVETKRPKGGKVSPHQEAIRKQLLANRCNHGYLKTKGEAVRFVQSLLTKGQ